ncbi:hypothetical protein L9F63_019162, partial [Diploptera punctata]
VSLLTTSRLRFGACSSSELDIITITMDRCIETMYRIHLTKYHKVNAGKKSV